MGTLFVVATPIGNLEDITVRALRVLRDVALIAAEDTRRTARLLAKYAIATPTTSLHAHNERQKTASLVDRLASGDSVALVSDAGTPTVSDPGNELIAAAIAAGVRVEPVPGPSAILTALAASGLPYHSFTFLGFPPIKGKERAAWFDRLVHVGGTVVLFEAPHRIRRTLIDLQDKLGDCQILLGRELTKTHEQLVRGPISRILNGSLVERGEFTVVVEIGHKANNASLAVLSDETLALQLGELTEKSPLTRRQAIAELAKRHGMTPNRVYAAVERAKSSG